MGKASGWIPVEIMRQEDEQLGVSLQISTLFIIRQFISVISNDVL